MQNATASWKPRDSSARVTASKLREGRSGQPLGCRTARESYFDAQQMSDYQSFSTTSVKANRFLQAFSGYWCGSRVPVPSFAE